MRNLTRIKGFIEAMEQYGQIVEVFLNVSDIIAFVWGPVKFLLQIASTWVESFDELLDAYEEISENIPQLSEYGELFKRHAHMRKVLELMYGDILEFHRRALKFFKRPTWKQLFRSSWKTFRTQFWYILSSLSRHKNLVESQASLAEYELSKAARIDAQDRFEEIAKAERLRRLLAVTEKIRPPNTLADHEGALEVRQEYPESGKWILQNPCLKDWMDLTCTNVPVLWVNGIPGAGKTVIASLIIEQTESIDSVNVGFFYCKYNDVQKNTFTGLLRTILVQLVQQNEELLPYVYDACCSSTEVTVDSPNLLKQLVETSLRSCANTCIIIDGLDECDEAEETKMVAWFLAILKNMTKDNERTIRLLFISQRDKITENLLKRASVIPLDSKYHQEDIQRYARHWSLQIQQKFGISECSASQIGTHVAAQAQGLFLFAKLVLMHLYSQTTRERLFKELQPESFPTGLETVYERIALRIFENPIQSEREDAHNIFRWIVCAKRPLKWSDVQSVFAVDPVLQRVDFDERQLRVTCRYLCGSLVETVAGDTLEFVHKSAKMYLVKTGRISVNCEELHIANFCMSYLNFGCFNADLTDLEIRDFLRQGYYSFEDYATAHWLDHVDSCTSRLLPVDSDILRRLTQTIESFFQKHGLNMPPDTPVSTDCRFQGLGQRDFRERLDSLAQLAHQRRSNENLIDLETQLQRRRLIYEDLVTNNDPHNDLVHTLSLSRESGWFKCPKTWCQFFSDGFQHKERRDAHVNQHERPFRCSFEDCLYAELGFGTEDQAKRHKKTSHPTGKDSQWAFPTHKPKKKLDIFSACKRGDLDTVKRLVGEGVDVKKSSRPKGSINALSLAVKYDHPLVVSYLIGQGCEQTHKMLVDAIDYASTAVVQMLLAANNAPVRKDPLKQRILHRAASLNRQDAIPLLLAYGIDINQKYKQQGGSLNVLQTARRLGHHSFAQALLDNGALDQTPEPEQPPSVTPVAPVTPRHPDSFAPSEVDRQSTFKQKNVGSSKSIDPEGALDGPFSMPFNSDLNNPDILENLDFEKFLQTSDGDFNFVPSTFEAGDDIEVNEQNLKQQPTWQSFVSTSEALEESISVPFNSDLNNPDIHEKLDFEQFLETSARATSATDSATTAATAEFWRKT